MRLDRTTLWTGGWPADGPATAGLENLRETRRRLCSRAVGEAAQLVVASIGDSWTHQYAGWAKATAQVLKARYGDAGPGWSGFGVLTGAGYNGNVDHLVCKPVYPRAADWSFTQYGASTSPDIASVSSTVAGATIAVTGGPTGVTGVNLFARGTADGIVRYRFDAGSWTELSLAGAGMLILPLAGVPSTAWTLDIEVVSGTVRLLGIDATSTASGVRWHKLPSSGSSSASWAANTGADWSTGLASLAPNLVVIMLATNDQGRGVPVSAFAANMATLIARARTATPAADILLVAPPENQRGLAPRMAEYAQVLRHVAAVHRTAFLDLQPAFGASPADYAFGSNRPWFLSDGVHPDTATGSRAIAAEVLSVLRIS